MRYAIIIAIIFCAACPKKAAPPRLEFSSESCKELRCDDIGVCSCD